MDRRNRPLEPRLRERLKRKRSMNPYCPTCGILVNKNGCLCTRTPDSNGGRGRPYVREMIAPFIQKAIGPEAEISGKELVRRLKELLPPGARTESISTHIVAHHKEYGLRLRKKISLSRLKTSYSYR